MESIDDMSSEIMNAIIAYRNFTKTLIVAKKYLTVNKVVNIRMITLTFEKLNHSFSNYLDDINPNDVLNAHYNALYSVPFSSNSTKYLIMNDAGDSLTYCHSSRADDQLDHSHLATKNNLLKLISKLSSIISKDKHNNPYLNGHYQSFISSYNKQLKNHTTWDDLAHRYN